MRTIVIVLLLTATLSLSLSEAHERFRSHMYNSKVLTLTLDYACNQQTQPQDCKFSIEWNGRVVKTISPIDYNKINKESIKLRGGYGKNTVKIVGNGNSNDKGIDITNVNLVRTISQRHFQPRNQQLLLNINFSSQINNDTDWFGSGFQIKSTDSTKPWPQGSHICELSAGKFIGQSVYFGWKRTAISKAQFLQLKKKEKIFILSFDYAAQQNTNLIDNKFQVQWNGQTIQQISPQDFTVHKAQISIQPVPGQKNTLGFKSLSSKPEAGCSFHKVYVKRSFSLFTGKRGNFHIIKNGWFQSDRFVISHEETIFDNGMAGWQGNPINIAVSDQVNKLFDTKQVKHFPVCHLTANSQLSQDIYFDKDLYAFHPPQHKEKKQLTLGFSYAAAPDSSLADNKFTVVFNGKQIIQINPQDYKKHYAIFTVDGLVGKNQLSFTGQGSQQAKGAGISYVSLTRISHRIMPYDLIKNKAFNQPKDKNCSNVGWKSDISITVLPGVAYKHHWDWDGKGCVSLLAPNHPISSNFQLSTLYEYLDPREVNVTLAKKQTLKLMFGYYAKQGQKLEDSKFTIEWNGQIIKEVIPTNYYQSHQVVYLTARVGNNTLKITGTGGLAGKGGAFNYIRLLRSSTILQPHIIAKLTVPRSIIGHHHAHHNHHPHQHQHHPHPHHTHIHQHQHQEGHQCLTKIYSLWKGNTLEIIQGKRFNKHASFSDCILQLKKGESIVRQLSFNDKYQSI